MKKIIFGAFLLAVLLLFVISLCSCGVPSGCYVDASGSAQFVFDNNRVEFNLGGLSGSGTYRIEGDMLCVSYEYDSSEVTLTYSYRKDGDSIFINGVEYTKQ